MNFYVLGRKGAVLATFPDHCQAQAFCLDHGGIDRYGELLSPPQGRSKVRVYAANGAWINDGHKIPKGLGFCGGGLNA